MNDYGRLESVSKHEDVRRSSRSEHAFALIESNSQVGSFDFDGRIWFDPAVPDEHNSLPFREARRRIEASAQTFGPESLRFRSRNSDDAERFEIITMLLLAIPIVPWPASPCETDQQDVSLGDHWI
jgi:hypothetical protein